MKFGCRNGDFIRRLQIYATSVDCGLKAQATRQNQLHWVLHEKTAAEVIYHRVDSEKEHMECVFILDDDLKREEPVLLNMFFNNG